MSLRGDILGWVIRELSSVNAADPLARAALFEALRAQVAHEGAFGAPPAEAAPHLESAIARQDVYWMTQEPAGHAPPRPSPPARPATPPPAPAWRWPRHIAIPPLPAGEQPGDPTGPYSDHIYQDFTLDTPNGPVRLTVSWTSDPACQLAASTESGGFSFRTRTATLAGALAHLDAYLQAGGLALPAAAWRLAG